MWSKENKIYDSKIKRKRESNIRKSEKWSYKKGGEMNQAI